MPGKETPDYNFATPDEALKHISEASPAELPLILRWVSKRIGQEREENENPHEQELTWMKAAEAAFTLISLEHASPKGDSQAEDKAIDRARDFYNRPQAE